MKQTFVLYEHAAGYALFRVNEFEETGMLLPQVEASVTDASRFKSVVKLVGFSPFKNACKALENVNSISEGLLPEDLQVFLQTSLPEIGGKKFVLGVSDPKLAASISETFPGIICQHTGAIPEILRGIRMHFCKLVKGFTDKMSSTAQLGLSHGYGRTKIKFNVHREDNMIIQSIALLDQLDKDINTFSMRLREWYSYHFPELYKIVPENQTYIRLLHFIKNRKELCEEHLENLEEIVMDSAKAQAILDASRSSMGMDISPVDLINIELFASRVINLVQFRKQLSSYLITKISEVAPNLAALLGEQVAARLISHAGSLTNLAKYPASTVQILGAEKALFRALKTRGNTPKYGLLFHSTFIARAESKFKGRVSRFLANKCSIASRIDCFTDEPTNVFGEKLKQQVEDRIKFYETGATPAKNVEVMHEAIEEANKIIKKRLKKKRKLEALQDAPADVQNGFLDTSETIEPPKKKKKKKHTDIGMAEEAAVNGGENIEELDAPKKKKKKKKNKNKDMD